jgi:hypothetical protein
VVQSRCRGAEKVIVQEVLRFGRGGVEEVWRRRDAEVQCMCRGDAEALSRSEVQRCRGAEVLKC